MKESAKTCCTPHRPDGASASGEAATTEQSPHPPSRAILIPGGKSLLGTNEPQIADDGETPLRIGKMQPFRISSTAITNEEFAKFVSETAYRTDAERFGWSFVFWSDVSQTNQPVEHVPGAEWWRKIEGANWQNINGPGSEATAWKADHPVVQVSWNDAVAYAKWAGGRLPSEAEWEHAARGGLGDVPFPWGGEQPDDANRFPCNIWQGRFPEHNSCADGYATTAPAQSFRPNGFGLYNMVGNVWEWTADTYRVKSLKKHVRSRMEIMRGFRLLKGGSFLCHRSYCYRYRIAARTGNSPESATTHQGFRVVWDV